MDNGVMVILLIICGVLVGIGIITALIMKKVKVTENTMTVTILITCFFALIAAGISVFLVSVNMMKDYINIRQYTEYTLSDEKHPSSILIKEYASHESTGFEIYFSQTPEKMLADLSTDKYLPFRLGEYDAEWQEDTVMITYTYHRTEDSYQAKSVTVSLQDGNVSESKDSDKDLRDVPNKPQTSRTKAA